MYIDDLLLELKEKGITVDVSEKDKLSLINSIKDLKSKIRKVDRKLKNKR